jgi:hypothetical protein
LVKKGRQVFPARTVYFGSIPKTAIFPPPFKDERPGIGEY